MTPERGSDKSTLDDKGRIIIPVDFRDFFEGELFLTCGRDCCARIMKKEAWERLQNEILHSDKLSPRQRHNLKNKHLNQYRQVELDKQGRIPIALHIREYAKLSRACMVVMDNDCLDIWDFDAWYAYLGENEKDNQAAFDILEL